MKFKFFAQIFNQYAMNRAYLVNLVNALAMADWTTDIIKIKRLQINFTTTTKPNGKALTELIHFDSL